MSNKTRKKQLKQLQNQAQQGRSMVEMLGVLAIIGVLSIGGISGYRMAMNRYQANQIANEINLMRTDAKVKTAQGAENLMLGEPYDSGHLNFGSNYGVEFNFAVFSEAGEPEESGYYIKVSGVPAGVCKPLVTLLEGMDDTIAVVVNNDPENDADSSADLCIEESNALEVDFSTKDIGGMSGANDESQNESACPGCQGHCTESGQCIECPADAPWNQRAGDCVCTDSDQHWNGNTCLTCPPEAPWDGKRCMGCSGGKVLSGGECVCPTGSTLDPSTEECACNLDTPRWTGTECTDSCPEGTEWSTYKEICICRVNGTYYRWNESIGECKERYGECQGNVDCDPGEYCYMGYGEDCSQEFTPEKFGEGYYRRSKCKKASTDKIEGEKSGYVKSQDRMTWWSAQRFCAALGRLPATRASIGCSNLGKSSGSGEDCTSETIAKLKEDFGTDNRLDLLWLEDGIDNCHAYFAALGFENFNSYISYGKRHNGWRALPYALCQ